MTSKSNGPVCPYCGLRAKKVTGADIYPHRMDLHASVFWSCGPCDAYVGCHGGAPGDVPLGRLSDAALRSAKQAAHAAFDPLWESGEMSRPSGYKWLAEQLGVRRDECHIGMFDIEMCRKVVEICAHRGFEDVS